MPKRYSPQINITLPAKMLTEIAAYQQELGLKRSTIIQFALRDWLARQQPIPPKSETKPKKRTILKVNGMDFDPDKFINFYMPTNTNVQDSIKILNEFEAAEKAYYGEY